MINLYVYENESSFQDFAENCIKLTHGFRARDLEKIDFTVILTNPDEQLKYFKVGNIVEVKRGEKTIFEGLIYERKLSRGRLVEAQVTAYSQLIKYERHIVYRLYPTGVKAGEIIRDLASLEAGVDVSNVDDGDALLAPWKIENKTALSIMRSTARGVNYWLRMKPGKKLYFKPKKIGEAAASIDESICLSVSYSEDRWELKNRVIYVGADNEVLADVSEGDGDLPIIVHDPFLTSREEALRRARIRLALNREYGRELEVTVGLSDFEKLGADLGDVVDVNLPSIGINEHMIILGIEYEFGVKPKVRLKLGGQHQLLEELLSEKIGGDVAARFGKAITIPEQTSTLAYSLDKIARIQADSKHVLYVNKPPLTLYNAQNVALNPSGEAELISGATEGSFETRVLPPSELFVNWVKAEWISENPAGEISVQFLNADGEQIDQVYNAYEAQFYRFKKWPQEYGSFTYKKSGNWGSSNASVSEERMGVLHGYCLKLTPNNLGSDGEIYYPLTKDLSLDLSWARWLRLYLYADHEDDVTIKIRLHQDESNYYQASLIVKAKEWRKYEINTTSLSQVGSPSLSNINWISIIAPYPILIDSDYIFLPAIRELLRVKFALKRDSPDDPSPKIKLIKVVWREHDRAVDR